MIGLYFLFGALALLVTLLLFGFVGCHLLLPVGPSSPTPDPSQPPRPPGGGGPHQIYPLPDYYKTIMETQDLVAYWRLGEPSTTPVPSPAGAAKSEVGGFHGKYDKLNSVTNPDIVRNSPTHYGELLPGVKPGLLELKPQDECACIDVNGGFVQVPWENALNPPQFSFEAWVLPDDGLDQKFYYCLVESTGPQGLVPKKSGWGLYLGPDNPNKTPPDPLAWQVWMGDGAHFKKVAIANPGRSQITLTFLVLTFDGLQNLQLWLYCPNTQQDLELLEVPVLKMLTKPINFQQNDASTVTGKGDFFIGTGSNLFPIFGPPPQRLYPFKGKIQEASLYKRDLSAPNNAGVQTTLVTHFLNGGNL